MAHYCFRCAKISSQVSPCYCSKQLQDIELAAKIDEQERNVRQAREMLANISQPKATKAVDKAVEAQDKVLVDRAIWEELLSGIFISDNVHPEGYLHFEYCKSNGQDSPCNCRVDKIRIELEAALKGGG